MKVAMVAAAALALLAVLAMSPAVRSADCNTITNLLAAPCLQYVVGSSSSLPTPQSNCCGAVSQLTPDQACKCLVGQMQNAPAWLNTNKAKAIPRACGRNFDINSCP
ncbi:hypothetical protein O6H91_21G032500 [Diphasiastrum complanatum]|nr:hypothetical protein O6H91_21G030400 [Diphasiastrum complanatum]KAJ7517635.1 hypothetical protein O6H91_21G032500 [Diphasiastrum complanatum]